MINITVPEFVIYVTPDRNFSSYSPQSLEGNSTVPFQDLQDALEKAHEKCAVYTSCEMTIYMMNGNI